MQVLIRELSSRCMRMRVRKVTLGNEATSTLITVRVTPESVLPSAATSCAADGVQCYTIEVYRIRANRETNADLATLSLEAKNLSRQRDTRGAGRHCSRIGYK